MLLPDHFYPYWSVYDGLGQHYNDCSHEKYAIDTVRLHPYEGFTYRIVNAPNPLPPFIVDVTAELEGELSGQQGLPQVKKRLPFEPQENQLKESKLKELEIDYD
tara:strand:- start:322 stop:633 length:312 start_codon:yes stop_codon:yes gene_type:complete